MQHVYKEDLQRFVQFAVRVWNVDDAFGDPERIALAGIQRQKKFFHELGLPVSLAEMSIGTERLEEMVEKATHYGLLGNFKKLNKEDVLQVLKLAL